MLPALIETLLDTLRVIASDKCEHRDKEVLLLKSDGMNKQKGLGWKAAKLMAQMYPELVSGVEHNPFTGETRLEVGPRHHRVLIVVCSIYLTQIFVRFMTQILNVFVTNFVRYLF